MLNIFDKHLLKITEGNSVDVLIGITDAKTKEPITIGDGDKVIFAAKDAKGTIALRKELTSNDISDDGHTLVMSLTPRDTMLITGEYPYDVLLSTFDGQAITFISSYMVIRPAVGLADSTGGET